MTRTRAILIALLALVSVVWFSVAQAAVDCSSGQCVYLPIVQRAPEPTATPTATEQPSVQPTATTAPTPQPSVPNPQAPCDANAPAPANGAQAWMSVPNPPRFSTTSVCARLISGGQVVATTMHATAHYKSTNTDLGNAATGADGVAHIAFNIGGATAGYTVVVDGTIGGQSFSTSFTP
jgi:hypothetical protein